MDSQIPLAEKARLIVLTPDSLAGNRDLAQKVHWMALKDGLDVFYLVLVDHEESMLSVSRSMATMKAMTSTGDLNVSSTSTETAGWLAALRENYQPGDVIVCHTEQSIRLGLLQVAELSDYLTTIFGRQVRTISGFYNPQRVQLTYLWHELVYWLGFVAILGLFSWAEIAVDHAIQGGTQTILLCFILCLEFGTILTWHDLHSRTR